MVARPGSPICIGLYTTIRIEIEDGLLHIDVPLGQEAVHVDVDGLLGPLDLDGAQTTPGRDAAMWIAVSTSNSILDNGLGQDR